MNLADIDRALRQLRLSGIAATLPTRVLQAQASQQPFLETLGQILQDELDRRRTRLNERRYKLSRLDERLTLEEFDWSFNPKVWLRRPRSRGSSPGWWVTSRCGWSRHRCAGPR